MQGDSQSFLLPAFDLAQGLGFDPILKRPPGYPLLIAGTMAAFGQSLHGLIFVQAVLGLGTVITTYWIARLAYGRVAGLLSAVTVAIGGQLLIYEHYVLAESVFAFLVALGVLAITVSVSHSRWAALSGGVLLAAATLFRPIAEVLVPLVGAFYLLVAGPWRRAARLFVVFLAGFMLLLAPSMVFDFLRQGGSSAGALGEVLIWRLTRPESGYFSRDDARGISDREPRAAERRYVIARAAARTPPQEIYNGLRREFGLSPREADGLMRDVALAAIIRDAPRYLVSTARMSVELFFAEDQRLGDAAKRDGEVRYSNPQTKQRTWFDDRILHLAEPPSSTLQNEFDRAQLLTSIYQPGRFLPIIAIGYLAGMIGAAAGRPTRLGLLPGLAALLMLFANAALSGPEPRFRYPIDPLIGIVAAGGLTVVMTIAVRRARRALVRVSAADTADPRDGERGLAPAS